MLGGLGRSLLLRLGSYALFLCGFWLLYQAFEGAGIGWGILGGAAILGAMWAMVGFRRPSATNSGTNPGSHRYGRGADSADSDGEQ